MEIPFIDLSKQYQSIHLSIDEAIRNVFNKSIFIGGDIVKDFENQFAQTINTKHCIGTGNGTDSLFLILKALDLKQEDEVIVPAFGCFPTAEAVPLAGVKIVFADVNAHLYTLDPDEVKKKITQKTKAIIAVHLYGQAVQLDELQKICLDHKIHLIEDCAQSHLTKFKGKPAGSFGIASAFSFYPTKNLGAYGDAGCVLTNDDALAEKIRRLANHGALQRNDHLFVGTNSRLDTIQASILKTKLKYLDSWNEKRQSIAYKYYEGLNKIDNLVLPTITAGSEHSFHIFCVRSPLRDELKKYLEQKGIQTKVHYPKGLPFTPAYASLNHNEAEFPVTAKLQNEVLSLPIYPELENDQIDYIIRSVSEFLLKN